MSRKATEMPCIQYIDRNLGKSRLLVIEQANSILAEYIEQGFTLTLRQLYYQFVARDLIKNNMREYKKLGAIINIGRLVGLIDWESIEDRTRQTRGHSHWNDPSEIVSDCCSWYHENLWDDQEHHVEVWVEKDALIGIVERVCSRWDVSYLSCRGYTSQSEMWAASQRLGMMKRNGKQPVIIHLGDHDPSGIDMTRDIDTRQDMFMGGVKVLRIALNMDQVEQYGPPPNPAKTTDSRAKEYIAQYGHESWELDALEPQVLVDLIESHIIKHLDNEQFNIAKRRQEKAREQLQSVSDRWEEICKPKKKRG